MSNTPAVDRHTSCGREVRVTRSALALTLIGLAVFLALVAHAVVVADATGRALWVTYGIAAVLVMWGAVVHMVCRLGYVRRAAAERSPGGWVLERAMGGPAAPSVLVLVPSYREEPAVVRRTLLSAMLLNHPSVEVVLLIDDPPAPRTYEDLALLRAARRLPGALMELVAPLRAHVDAALDAALARHAAGAVDPAHEAAVLADAYLRVADWLAALARTEGRCGHEERHFTRVVLARPERDLRARAAALRGGEDTGTAAQHLADLRALAARLGHEVSAFERKRYANLTHEPNKAMNLNAYLGLLGRRMTVAMADGERVLVPAPAGRPGTLFATPDYVLTLDADSVLDAEYVPRLLEVMEHPDNARVAVAQTPYSAVPGAPGLLERTAGATTDIQYVIHQGFTAHGATFWVGANALLRFRALAHIETRRRERGHEVRRFIQDRTVIEDTESSVDLIACGWGLHNHPQRLAWSATPADFGALVIQRRRWANGGLIILPKLLRHMRGRREHAQGFLRLHYLVSIAASCLASVLLLTLPVAEDPAALALPLLAVPYIAVYARDLRAAGRRRRDVFDVFALNLLLLPVNIGGVVMSLRQAIGGHKVPFARTPKIPGRTVVPAVYVAGALAGVLAFAAVSALAIAQGRLAQGLVGGGATAWMSYAFVRFIGVRAGAGDLVRPLRGPLRGAAAGVGAEPILGPEPANAQA